MRLPACKECRHYAGSRPKEEWEEYTKEWLYNGQVGIHPEHYYYGCDHPVTRQISNQFVSVHQMRNIGAPCGREGALYEGAE